MAANEIHVNDIGTVFEVTILKDDVALDISGFTDYDIKFKPPLGGDLMTVDAVYVTDGTDGKLQYTTVDGDLSVKGVWKVQGFVTSPVGSWHSEIEEFTVYKNLE
jgi:hypothetical protein